MSYKDREAQRAAQAEWARRKRAVEPERRTLAAPLLPAEFRLKKAADVVGVIESQMLAVLLDPDLFTVERARVTGFLAGVALRAIEAGDFQGRLEAVEAVLKIRKERSDELTPQ